VATSALAGSLVTISACICKLSACACTARKTSDARPLLGNAYSGLEQLLVRPELMQTGVIADGSSKKARMEDPERIVDYIDQRDVA